MLLLAESGIGMILYPVRSGAAARSFSRVSRFSSVNATRVEYGNIVLRIQTGWNREPSSL